MHGFTTIISIAAILSTAVSAAAVPAKTSSTAVATASACVQTKLVFDKIDLSKTTTSYLSTVTEYSAMDCKGCALTVLHVGGPGPVIPGGRTKTVTAKATTTTMFACADRNAFKTLEPIPNN